jgi:hypothetical protein
MKILPVEIALFHEDRRSDRHDVSSSVYSLCESVYKPNDGEF